MPGRGARAHRSGEAYAAPLAGIAGAPGAAVRSIPLTGDADARVRQTIAAMQRIARSSLRDADVLETAADIVQDVDGRDPGRQIRTLRAWLAERVRFLADPLIDGDVIRTPQLLLRKLERDGVMQGDCDDIATLAATLAHAIGLRARYVTLGFFGPDEPFRHVYTEVEDPTTGDWHELDVTETPETRARNEPTRREEHPALPEVFGSGWAPRLDVAGLLGVAELAILGYQLYKAGRNLVDEVVNDV